MSTAFWHEPARKASAAWTFGLVDRIAGRRRRFPRLGPCAVVANGLVHKSGAVRTVSQHPLFPPCGFRHRALAVAAGRITAVFDGVLRTFLRAPSHSCGRKQSQLGLRVVPALLRLLAPDRTICPRNDKDTHLCRVSDCVCASWFVAAVIRDFSCRLSARHP